MSEHVSTVVLAVDSMHPDAAPIARAAAVLRNGGLVAFPTETVYGLGANAFDPVAVARIFAAKQRPFSDPLIVHITALAQLDEIVRVMPATALDLARRFWPGPLTLVLPRHPRIPPNVSADMDTVAVRMPDHPVAIALLHAAGVPVAAPSANRFTRPSPTLAHHVIDDLGGRVDIVLDGGPTPIGLESSVVSLIGEQPTLLRPGGIPLEELQAQLPDLVYTPRYLDHTDANAAPTAPGMLLKHYAPNAEVLLFRGERTAVLERMRFVAKERAATSRIGALLIDEDQQVLADLAATVVSLGSGTNLAEVGARLFAGLRALEQQGAQVMLVRGFEQAGLGLAIWDRLLRATEGRVIEV